MSKNKSNKSQTLSLLTWSRTVDRLKHPKAIDRIIDETYVESLLKQRDDAKNVKNYSLADQIASELRSMDISYEDDIKKYYTHVIGTKSNVINKEKQIKINKLAKEQQKKSHSIKHSKNKSGTLNKKVIKSNTNRIIKKF